MKVWPAIHTTVPSYLLPKQEKGQVSPRFRILDFYLMCVVSTWHASNYYLWLSNHWFEKKKNCHKNCQNVKNRKSTIIHFPPHNKRNLSRAVVSGWVEWVWPTRFGGKSKAKAVKCFIWSLVFPMAHQVWKTYLLLCYWIEIAVSYTSQGPKLSFKKQIRQVIQQPALFIYVCMHHSLFLHRN